MMRLVNRLSGLTQPQLASWALQARRSVQEGQLPRYVPQLAEVDPNWLAVQVRSLDGITHSVGQIQQSFVLMSVVKPFVLLYLLETMGVESVFRRVGTIPSDQPFHSLRQLQDDRGWPRNPMINSGAIALMNLLPGDSPQDCCDRLRQWLNTKSGSRLQLDTAVLESVRLLKNETNHELAAMLVEAGVIPDAAIAMDTYNHVCCLAGTVSDLSQLGVMLATPHPPIPPSMNAWMPPAQQTVLALMLTCGLYEQSGDYAVQIGVPSKSGVSGALLSVIPGEGAIAIYSPPLDASGNSVAGIHLLRAIAQALHLSVFS